MPWRLVPDCHPGLADELSIGSFVGVVDPNQLRSEGRILNIY